MEREIKFRTWDGKRMIILNLYQAIHYDNDFILRENNNENWIDDHCGTLKFPIMQFTCLYDKNGKEIYEGDIVKNEQAGSINDEFPVGEIYFDELDASFIWDRGGTGSYQHGLGATKESINKYGYDNIACYLEIIGNVYENPELLNQ